MEKILKISTFPSKAICMKNLKPPPPPLQKISSEGYNIGITHIPNQEAVNVRELSKVSVSMISSGKANQTIKLFSSHAGIISHRIIIET